MESKSKKKVIIAACIFAIWICYLISTKSNDLLASAISQEQITTIKYVKITSVPGVMGGSEIVQGDIIDKEQIKNLLEILEDNQINRNYSSIKTDNYYPFIWIAIFYEIDSVEHEMSFKFTVDGKIIPEGGISSDRPVYSMGRIGNMKGIQLYESLDKFIESLQDSHSEL